MGSSARGRRVESEQDDPVGLRRMRTESESWGKHGNAGGKLDGSVALVVSRLSRVVVCRTGTKERLLMESSIARIGHISILNTSSFALPWPVASSFLISIA